MSIMTKLLPVAALGVVGAMNSDVLKENLDLISKAKSAATSGIEMRGIADAVAAEYSESGRLPLRNFAQFMKNNLEEKGGGKTRDMSKDMWESPYRIVADIQKNGFEIWSAGPDKLWLSEDDLRYTYDLTALGGKKAINAAQYGEWNALAMAYKRQNEAQAAGNSDGGNAVVKSGNQGKPAGKTSDRERNRLEALMKRVKSGSSSAKLDLAERMMKGDALVEKNLQQAKTYLEEALGATSSNLEKKKIQAKLDEVKATIEIDGIPGQ